MPAQPPEQPPEQRVNTPCRTSPRPAPPVHRRQGLRYPDRDYRIPAFYLITITTLDRRPRFGTCSDNRMALSEEGHIVLECWQRIAHDYPKIDLSTLVIMPDHLHGIVRVTEYMDQPVGVPLRAFKSQVTSALRKRDGDTKLQLWAPGYHDWAVWKRGALAAYTHYIRDNPRRYCLKKTHPDLFRRINDLQHARLPPGEPWTGYGNLFLLDKPEIQVLQVSRRIAPAELDALRRTTLEQVKNGAILVSPFISPGEKNIARGCLDAGGSVILMKPEGFGPYFKPHGQYFDLCLQGRLLILACRPPTTAKEPLTRELCLTMNNWSSHIAQCLPPPA